MVIKHKTFESDTAATLDTAVNTFLATLDTKNVLDVMASAFASSKYGETKTFTTTVIYKE
jgi:hypothetical protein